MYFQPKKSLTDGANIMIFPGGRVCGELVTSFEDQLMRRNSCIRNSPVWKLGLEGIAPWRFGIGGEEMVTALKGASVSHPLIG